MRRFTQVGLAVAVLALMASPVLAQQQRRPGGGAAAGGGQMGLLANKAVQEDLKLTDDQITKVKDAATKQRAAFQGLGDLSQEERVKKMQELNKENTKVLDEILKPEQKKRLRQLSLQQQGAMALATPQVAKALNVTDDQKDKLKSIQDDVRKQMGELRQGGGGNREEMAKKRAEITKATNEKVMGLLTADQKAKWKEMTGEPFKGTLPPAGFGGAGGRRPGAPPARPDK